MELIEKKERNHFELKNIENFMRLNEYPKTIKEWGGRSNFKRARKNFSIENGQFLYKRQRVVVTAKQKQLETVKDVQAIASKAMASHKDSTY